MPVRDGELDLWAAMLSRANLSETGRKLLSTLRSARVEACSADRIAVVIPGQLHQDDLAAVRSVIEHSAEDLLGRRPLVEVEKEELRSGREEDSWRPALNPAYTFENFVIGPSNRLAHAAAVAVSESPGKAYNPLFIHSASGMGKTHLLQAICRRVLERHRGLSLVYTSCEDFQNQFFSAVEAGRVDAFRERFRLVDMLVVDDVHFLANRERTQEEFFHTFNALYNSSRQIVLSCDCPPREIPELQERLVSRFKWGLVAEIEPPSFETRMEIVRVKSQMRGYSLPPDVVKLLAERCDGNVRELEGAVLKIVGYAGLLGVPVDTKLAEEVLASMASGGLPRGRVGIEDIVEAVAKHYRLTPAQIQARSRVKSVALARQVCMYLARSLTGQSLESLGAYFGGRDHSTVKHACDRIEELMRSDPDFAATMRGFERKLRLKG